MDIKTGLAIYNQPWLIEPGAAVRMLAYWEKVNSKESTWDYAHIRSLEKSEETPVITSFQFNQKYAHSEVRIAPTSKFEMRDFKGFDGAKIALIPISGVVMKNDYCGDFGTQSLKQMTQLAGSTPSVETIVFLVDTPGGTVDGTEVFAEAIRNSPKNTIAVIGGMCCSAGYWLGSSAKELYATSNTDMVGSIGTMMAWYDDSKRMEEMGVEYIEVYATKSTDKNAAYNEANDGKPKRLIKTLLDPMNNAFMASVQANRKGKIDLNKEDVLTGEVYVGQAAVDNGLIDGILSFEDIINKTLAKNSINNSKTYAMSKPTLVFGATLVAAKATEFTVVEGGFLLTEEHLNNIDAKLDQDDVTAKATAASLKALQAQSETFTQAETTAAALVAANAKIVTLEADLATANAAIKTMGGQAGAEMATTTKKEDKPTDAPATPKAPDSFEKMAAQLLP